MINPVSPAVVIPWQGKTYSRDISNGSIAAVEAELGVSIMFGWGEPHHLSAKPEFYQRAVWLYVLMHGITGVTFSACCDAAVGDNALRIMEAINKAVSEQMTPKIRKLYGVSEAPDNNPLAESSDGPASGPPQESTSASPTASSGDTPLANSAT